MRLRRCEALTPARSAILRSSGSAPSAYFPTWRRGSTRHPHRTVSGGLRAWARHTATRPVVNRCRHLPTVTFEQRSFAATATFDSPRAHLRTIFARKATCRFVLARLASRSSSPRSTAVTSNLALGRPVLAMPPNTSHPAHFLKLFQTQGTRPSPASAVGGRRGRQRHWTPQVPPWPSWFLGWRCRCEATGRRCRD